MEQLGWVETINAIIDQETKKKEELDKFDNLLKTKLSEINTPCDFLKDLLAKIWSNNQIPEHYKRDLTAIIQRYLSENKCV